MVDFIGVTLCNLVLPFLEVYILSNIYIIVILMHE